MNHWDFYSKSVLLSDPLLHSGGAKPLTTIKRPHHSTGYLKHATVSAIELRMINAASCF
jgi:hypothetical protein